MESQNSHEYFIQEAIKESKLATELKEGDPFGAVVVKDGKIIARGHNQIILLNDVTAHGEMQALRNAGKELKSWKLNDCILYSSCEPCSMCHTATIWAGIKSVYFGMSAGDLQELFPHITKDYAKSEINKEGPSRNTPYYQIESQIEDAKKAFGKTLPTD